MRVILPEASPWTKFERAKEHFQVLTAEVMTYLERLADEPNFYGADTEIDEDSRECFSYLTLPEPPNYLRWAALVGEGMHALRCALDHMIEAATIRHTGNPLPFTEFPIFDIAHGTRDRVGYLDTKRNGEPKPRSGLYRVRGIDPGLAAFVEALQPYQYGDRAHHHTLWRLAAFDNIDKHRVIPFFGLGGPITKFEVSGWEIDAVRVYPFLNYEDGAPIAHFTIGEGSGTMEVEVEISFQVRFAEGEPGFGEEVIPILEDALMGVYSILGVFQEVVPTHENFFTPPGYRP